MIVIILKHVGITDWDKERLKMTVNMPAICSAPGLRTRCGTVQTRGLTSVDLIKDLTHFGLGERDHLVLSVCVLVCVCVRTCKRVPERGGQFEWPDSRGGKAERVPVGHLLHGPVEALNIITLQNQRRLTWVHMHLKRSKVKSSCSEVAQGNEPF